nr:unnamed protein product [Callosobruchus analis]
MDRPLSDKELLEIIECNEFWKEDESDNVEGLNDEHDSDKEDRRSACESIFTFSDQSDQEEDNELEVGDHDSDSEQEWEPPNNDKESDSESDTDRDVSEFGKLDDGHALYGKDKTKWATDAPHAYWQSSREYNKPEIVLFYHDTKAGVDALHQKCANYSTSRKTRRRPMELFHMILNVAGINSRVLYKFSNPAKEVDRKEFLHNLASSLCRPHMTSRTYNVKIPRKLRSLTADILGVTFDAGATPSEPTTASKRKRCAFCPSKKDHKTSTACRNCKKPVCRQCAKNVCPDCV